MHKFNNFLQPPNEGRVSFVSVSSILFKFIGSIDLFTRVGTDWKIIQMYFVFEVTRPKNCFIPTTNRVADFYRNLLVYISRVKNY